jgi:hypothetical protein
MLPPPAELHIMGGYPGAMRIGRWQNVVVCGWSGAPTGQPVNMLASIMVQLHANSSEVRSYVHIIPDQAGLPDAAARSVFRNIMIDYEPYIACVGVVVAGGGFWASAMRSVVSGLRLLLPTPFDYRLHTTTAELLTWFPAAHRKRTGVEITVPQLSALLREGESWTIA